ncbi:MAG TPA: glutamate--tRNA ligase [Solirubrobacterales bacterium]|nr:glutamate--tRNA ligase [Solirubrobacterales bacterium]
MSSRQTSPESRFRFAPSPTGWLHIGGARTALYNWLLARGSGGTLVLRIEDTDRERSTPENTEQILDALRYLELDWDEGPLSQYERRDRHRDVIARLVDEGHAYYDPATSADVRTWKKAHGGAGYRGEARSAPGAAIRLRVPDEGETVVDDAIRGEVRFENRSQDDFVIARGDGTPLYNLAVAVDDADMGITDVVRGDDHLSNTPKQLLVLRALGSDPPRYAHLPLLHSPSGGKLSKREAAASVQDLRDAGYLPAAVRNYLALLGWGTEDDTTLMSTEELVERFEIERVGRSPAIFDARKLRWMNGRYMRELPLEEYERRLGEHLRARSKDAAAAFLAAPAELRRTACEIVRDKAQTLDEVWLLIRFLFADPVEDPGAWEKVMTPDARDPLIGARDALRSADGFSAKSVEGVLSPIVERSGRKPRDVYQPIRVAITGTTVSPGIFESLSALGREESLRRIDAALRRLGAG